jgi:hypothetical protein
VLTDLTSVMSAIDCTVQPYAGAALDGPRSGHSSIMVGAVRNHLIHVPFSPFFDVAWLTHFEVPTYS